MGQTKEGKMGKNVLTSALDGVLNPRDFPSARQISGQITQWCGWECCDAPASRRERRLLYGREGSPSRLHASPRGIGDMAGPCGSHKFKTLICSGKVNNKRPQCKNVLEINTSHAQMLQALRPLCLL